MATAEADRTILALNCGSSSLKFGLFQVGRSGARQILSGAAEAIGDGPGKFWLEESGGNRSASEAAPIPSQIDALDRVEKAFAERRTPVPAAIGHRVVHGGAGCRQHCVIDESVLRQLEAATGFAPLHVAPALATIRHAQQRFPQIPQVACLDTAFHATLPDRARVLPIPAELGREGIERYGFHGLSCESILHRLGRAAPDRLVIAHLGNGASVTAVRGGRSIDTSMGLTPTGGVIMGTRCGDLDPGVLAYLVRVKGFDAARLEECIDHRSGLLGISGLSSDMRRLHEAAPANPRARLAIEMFCHAARKQIAAMIAALDGIDLLVFTGGIGEHDAEVRGAICAGLSWVGIELDAARNRSAADVISRSGSACSVRVLPALEDEQIARHSWELTAGIT
jgi:acetate kinase